MGWHWQYACSDDDSNPKASSTHVADERGHASDNHRGYRSEAVILARTIRGLGCRFLSPDHCTEPFSQCFERLDAHGLWSRT